MEEMEKSKFEFWQQSAQSLEVEIATLKGEIAMLRCELKTVRDSNTAKDHIIEEQNDQLRAFHGVENTGGQYE